MSAKKFVFISILVFIPQLAFIIYDVINGNTLLAALTSFVLGIAIGLGIGTYNMKKASEKMIVELEASRKILNDILKSQTPQTP